MVENVVEEPQIGTCLGTIRQRQFVCPNCQRTGYFGSFRLHPVMAKPASPWVKRGFQVGDWIGHCNAHQQYNNGCDYAWKRTDSDADDPHFRDVITSEYVGLKGVVSVRHPTLRYPKHVPATPEEQGQLLVDLMERPRLRVTTMFTRMADSRLLNPIGLSGFNPDLFIEHPDNRVLGEVYMFNGF